MLDLEPHEKQWSEHTHSIADEYDGLDENVHLNEEWNEKADWVANEHKPVDLLGIFVLEVDYMAEYFLLTDVTISLFDDIQDHVWQIIVCLSELGHDALVVAAGHDFTIWIRMLFNVLNFLLKYVEAHIKEQALDLMILAIVKWIGLLQEKIYSVIRILSKLVILMQVWESLKALTLISRQVRYIYYLANIKL